MDFQYSSIVDPSTYETEGLCEGIALRQHKNFMLEVRGAERAQKDWTRLVRPVFDYKGGLGPKYSFMQVTVPECLPERLEIISYANEFAFLYDDIMECMDFSGPDRENDELLDVFRKNALHGSIGNGVRGEKVIQSQILSEMMAIDPERAMTTMKAWSTFIEQSAVRERSEPFETLADYLPYRIIDAGEMIWYGTVTFGMALSIPEAEFSLCRQLVMPAFAVLSLTNDLFSWYKEREAAEKEGLGHVVNAIWVIMRERCVTEEHAKDICRIKIKEYVADYIRVVEETKKRLDISLDLRVYVEAILYSMSGNLVWSLYCPRYHHKISQRR